MQKFISVLILLVFLACSFFSAPALSKETGKLQVFSEIKGADIYVDGVLVGKDSVILNPIDVGSHYVKAMQQDKVVWSEIVDITPGATKSIVIKTKSDITEPKEPEKQIENTAPNESKTISSRSSKKNKITIKGLCLLNSTMHTNTSISNFDNTGYNGENASDLTIDPGFGIGCEAEYFKISDTVDLIAGLSYGLSRNVTHIKGEIKSDGLGSEKYSENIKKAQISLSSIYAKIRFMFPPFRKDSNFYTAAKLSYNIASKSGDEFDYIAIDNALGYGFSLGAIINDEWDFECCTDYISGNVKEDWWVFDGVNLYTDTLSGTYSLWVTHFSLGYRF